MSILPFDHPQFGQLRAVEQDSGPWFVAADVCQALDIQNTSQAIAALDEDERSMLSIGRQGNAHIINESGLYALTLRCRDAMKPGTKAHAFRKWVTSEVLPAIRKTGSYSVESHHAIPATYADALQLAANLEKERAALAAENEAMKPKALFADVVMTSKDGILIGDAAKVGDLGLGQNTLFEQLRNDGVLIKDGKRRNHPAQRYIDQGLFTLSESTYLHPRTGAPKIRLTPHVTQKGLDWLIKHYRQESKIIPITEGGA